MRGSLKKKRDFREVYDQGLKTVGHHVVAFVLLAEEPPPPDAEVLVGVVASKKVGNAVRRARAKRVLRAAFADLRRHLPAGTRVVLVARHAAADADVRSPRVREELVGLLRRQGIEMKASS